MMFNIKEAPQKTYRSVRLIQNRRYPTYQLHGYMANKKTSPEDGLRIAVLCTMEWLRQRLGDHAPEEWQRTLSPSEYLTTTNQDLFSLHLTSGYVVDIVSLPDDGIWTLQITEPDLGSDPGNPEQKRDAVPGRVIETNIGYRITGGQLACGFNTVISDLEGTTSVAEVYRLAIVRRLIDFPQFGLKQITPLNYDVTPITTLDQLKSLRTLLKEKENQLPCVVFTHLRESVALPTLDLTPSLGLTMDKPMLVGQPNLKLPPKTAAKYPPYDMKKFAQDSVGFCRTYLLDDKLLERFHEMFGLKSAPGDVCVLEPQALNGEKKCYSHKASMTRQKELMEKLSTHIGQYPLEKELSSGEVIFLSEARKHLLQSTETVLQHSTETETLWAQQMVAYKAQWQEALSEKDGEIVKLRTQLERQGEYIQRIEGEKEALRISCQEQVEQERLLVEREKERVAFLERKLAQPKVHSQIASWVKDHFSERLMLHSSAVALLEQKNARDVNLNLICDALDFLATDYWETRYHRLSKDDMNTRCSEKYGRPFEVKPTGKNTVEYTPHEYKIKYFEGHKGKLVESPLDCHLGVGNDPENLLRIYFLHDDKKQLIVVGSLPRHLRSITIK